MDLAIQELKRAAALCSRLRPLNIFITDRSEEAVNLFVQDSARYKNACLFGVPVGIKDCFSTKNIRTTCASRMLSDYVPPYNATVVERLANAGAVVLGKSNMDEFSMGSSSTHGYFGAVRNPWTLKLWYGEKDLLSKLKNDWLIAGGSSGGSAAAVAAHIVKIAVGSDTGGSTRNPASFCGVIGFKPTYGLLSRHGLISLVNALDVPGILARKVEDVAAAFEIMAGMDVKDSTTVDFGRCEKSAKSFKDLKIGLPKEYFTDDLSDSVVKQWMEVAALLERTFGCKLVEVSLPHTAYSIICYHVIGESEIASNMARYDGIEYGHRVNDNTSLSNMVALSRQEGFNEVVRRRILAGNYFLLKRNFDTLYLQAAKVRRLIANDFYDLFRREKVDILLTPTTSSDAPLYSEYVKDDDGYQRERRDDYFTQSVNLAGIPAIAIPVGFSERGLPIGLQLIGDRFKDRLLLRMAASIEEQVQFPGLSLKYLELPEEA